MSTRNLKIDTLRGLACVLLVTYHVIGAGSNSGLRIPDGEPVRLFNDSLVYLRMPLFSFLSGFVYAWRPFDGDAKRFVTGKVKRLLIPMLLVATFFAILQANTPGANDRDYDWSMLHIVPVAHYWFLESLFIIFMLVSVLERLRLLRTEWAFLAIWLAAVALHLMDPLPVYFGMLGAVYLLPYFLLGVWCNRFGGRYPRRGILATAAVLVLAVATYLVSTHHDFPSRNSPIALLLGACGCLFLISLRPQSHRLAWIGVHSFAIYLFHTIFSAASRIALHRTGDFPTALLMVSGIAAGLLGPIVVEAVLRRVPSIGSWVLGESIALRKHRPAVEAGTP